MLRFPEYSDCRRAVVAIAWVIFMFSLASALVLIAVEGKGIVGRIIRLGLMGYLCWKMVEGANWSRYVLVIMNGLSALTVGWAAFRLGFPKSIFFGLWFLALAGIYAGMAGYLLISAKIEGYFRNT